MFKVDNKTLVHDVKYVKKVKKLTIHAPEQSIWPCPNAITVNIGHIPDLVLVF